MFDDEFEVALHMFAKAVDQGMMDADYDGDDPDILDLICGEFDFDGEDV